MKITIRVLMILLGLSVVVFGINYAISDKQDKLTSKEVAEIKTETARNTTSQKPMVEKENSDSFFELNEQDVITINSEVDTLGESLEVIKNQGNVSLVRGKYGNTLNFYRLYLIDNEGVNIYYEVTEDKPEYQSVTLLMEAAKYDEIFNLESNQEFFLIKTPYEVGNEWGYGKITKADENVVVVDYENGNEITFTKGIGITEIQYQMPDEMKEYFTEEQFKAKRSEG